MYKTKSANRSSSVKMAPYRNKIKTNWFKINSYLRDRIFSSANNKQIFINVQVMLYATVAKTTVEASMTLLILNKLLLSACEESKARYYINNTGCINNFEQDSLIVNDSHEFKSTA